MQISNKQKVNTGTIVCEPGFETWQEVLNKNLQNRQIDQSLRHEVIQAALHYTQSLVEIAAKANITMQLPALERTNDSTAIIMAGHQPVIYHAGLLRKNLYLQELSKSSASLGINLVIDLDDVNGGQIKFPQLHNDNFKSSFISISEGSSLLKFQKIKSKQDQEPVWQNIFSSLKACGASTNWDLFEQVKKTYQALAGVGLKEANSIVRTILEPGRDYLELPLSSLVQLPKVQKSIRAWCNDGDSLHSIYNSTLAEHRLENGIKNSANPFPDLKTQALRKELPFWLIDETQSKRLIVWREGTTLFSSDSNENFKVIAEEDLGVNKYLSPRGAIVSLLYRGFCSDFFIHGLGGRTYDTFTDKLAPKLISKNLPKFVVASETRYLFSAFAEKVLNWESLETNTRDIISHTEKYLDQSLFDNQTREKLQGLIEKKQQLIPQLAAVKVPADRVPLGQTLKLVNDEIRRIVEDCLTTIKPYSDESTRNVWVARDYPAFF